MATTCLDYVRHNNSRHATTRTRDCLWAKAWGGGWRSFVGWRTIRKTVAVGAAYLASVGGCLVFFSRPSGRPTRCDETSSLDARISAPEASTHGAAEKPLPEARGASVVSVRSCRRPLVSSRGEESGLLPGVKRSVPVVDVRSSVSAPSASGAASLRAANLRCLREARRCAAPPLPLQTERPADRVAAPRSLVPLSVALASASCRASRPRARGPLRRALRCRTRRRAHREHARGRAADSAASTSRQRCPLCARPTACARARASPRWSGSLPGCSPPR